MQEKSLLNQTGRLWRRKRRDLQATFQAMSRREPRAQCCGVVHEGQGKPRALGPRNILRSRDEDRQESGKRMLEVDRGTLQMDLEDLVNEEVKETQTATEFIMKSGKAKPICSKTLQIS